MSAPTPPSWPEPVLVTGAAGFVGGAVARRLRERGHRVVATDRDARRAPEGTLPLDLTDAQQVGATLREHRPATILHFAAYGQGDAGLLASAERDPERAVAVNLDAFVTLLDAAAEAGTRRLVWSSSTTVYGPPRLYAPRERVDEASPPAPTSSYGATKMLAERIAAHRAPTSALRVTGLRLPLVYGPGRWYGGAQAAWMAFARAMAAGGGGAHAFSGAPEDWIFIDDAVSAVLRTAASEARLDPVYNVAGTTISAAEAARTLARLAGSDATVTARDGAAGVVLVDGSALERATGYAPAVSMEDGLRRLLDALRSEGRTP